MAEKSEPSRAIANCLRCLRLGAETQDLNYMEAWMHQAKQLVRIQGSDEQRAQVHAYEEEIIRLREIESLGGPGSALLTEHPLVIHRAESIRRREERLNVAEG